MLKGTCGIDHSAKLASARAIGVVSDPDASRASMRKNVFGHRQDGLSDVYTALLL